MSKRLPSKNIRPHTVTEEETGLEKNEIQVESTESNGLVESLSLLEQQFKGQMTTFKEHMTFITECAVNMENVQQQLFAEISKLRISNAEKDAKILFLTQNGKSETTQPQKGNLEIDNCANILKGQQNENSRQIHPTLKAAAVDKANGDVGLQTKDIKHENTMEAASNTIHQRYKCYVCKRVFINNRTLKKHRKLHSKKEFYCFVCPEYGKEFGHPFPGQDDFDIHMLSHSSKCIFQCRFCTVYFARESKFKLHVRFHKNKIGHATYLSSLFEKGCRAGRRYRAIKKRHSRP